jgi:hypothetical protein
MRDLTSWQQWHPPLHRCVRDFRLSMEPGRGDVGLRGEVGRVDPEEDSSCLILPGELWRRSLDA